MPTNKFHHEEKRRLHRDITLRNRITSVDEAEELALRIQDTIEHIQFSLQSERDLSNDEYTDDQYEDWRIRAQRAAAWLQLMLSQILRRRDLLVKMGVQQKYQSRSDKMQ
jgi:hypothetical protein